MLRRATAVATGLSLALAVGACGSKRPTPHESTSPSVQASAEAYPPFHESPLPDKLPPAVARLALNAVAIHIVVGGELAVGTGFRITPNQALTDGHVISDDGKLLPRSTGGKVQPTPQFQCGALEADIATSTPITTRGDGQPLSGTELWVQRAAYAYNGLNTDIGLVEFNPTDAPLAPFTPVHFRTTPVLPGTQLFALSFQPTASGDMRTPDQSQLTADELQAGDDKPAIVGGYALPNPNGTGYPGILVTKNYQGPDGALWGGGSGTVMLDAQGEIVSIFDISPVSASAPPPTNTEASQLFQTELPGDPNAPAYYGFGQDVTPGVVSALQRAVTLAPQCRIGS